MKKEYQTSKLRSKIMRAVKSKNTSAELSVRKILCQLGYRYYRLNVGTLPGSPDVVFKKFKKVIFVNGCFWHGHNCNKGRLPKSNIKFWETKVKKNRQRDKQVYTNIKKLGWKYLIVWQCEIKNKKKLLTNLTKFFSLDNVYCNDR